MDRPGERLRRARERLKLTFRDVARASHEIASRRGSDEFAIALSRLADIENKGTLPTIYRLYSLCAIYRLDLDEVLRWYGVAHEDLASEAAQIALDVTHAIQLGHAGPVALPPALDREIDLERTTFLSHLIRRWGTMPFTFLNAVDMKRYRYGFIGLEDWSMYPILYPGALVAIDENRRKIAADGWTGELDRPIYFLEHRDFYLCGWCALEGSRLIVLSHPASHRKPAIFEYEKEIDVVGQVAGVAMLLEPRKRRHARSATTPAKFPNP
jgi:transcriptional regulator with XRE-family HTH domain